MSNNNDVKIETIWENKQVKGNEKIETIYPETIQLPDYSYWFNQEPLDYNRLRNKPSWWNTKYKIWTYNITSTWIKNITWIWFKPTRVEVKCIFSSWWNPVWFGSMVEGQQWSMSMAFWWSPITPNILYVLNVFNSSDTLICRASNNGFIDDWFSINVTTLSTTWYLIYECFW